MPRAASSTGLIAARVRPVRRPKPKKIEFLGPSVPAPFTLRPFAGLFNPYPYGCSVLCNHPADGEAKDVVRRAKDAWTSEGKTLLLPSELELLHQRKPISGADQHEGVDVPEELFRRYTETDSRPVTPITIVEPPPTDDDATNRETFRTTIVLDLRASSHEIQENETLSWRALTLEPIPSSRRSDFSSGQRRKPPSSRNRTTTALSSSPVRSAPTIEVNDAASTRSAPTNLAAAGRVEGDDNDEDDDEDDSGPEESAPMRRRGKLRRKKRKCRRGSIYGQPTEVREPPEPLETQVSQIDEGSRRASLCTTRLEETRQASLDKGTLPAIKQDIPPSFLPPEVLKELSRELDREVVEWEFNAKRRIALEEALRVSGGRPVPPPRQSPIQPLGPSQTPVPRLFYRQSARFELLDSQSLIGLRPLDYLARHVYVSDARKSLFGRIFNKYREESKDCGPRYILTRHLSDALQDVMGRALLPAEFHFLESAFSECREKLDFRTWCGVCAFAERSLPELPRREDDPASWLERADFETLERRIRNVNVDEKLADMLRLVRDR